MKRIPALEDAIAKKNLVGIYSVFYTIAHGDPNFSSGKFRNMLNYVKKQNIAGFIQEFDEEEFEPEDKWNEDYWAEVASSLMDNFCEERINHLEAVGKKVYPKKVVEQSNDIKNTNISKNKSINKSINRQQEVYNKRLITEESKRQLKDTHANRTRKLKPGFLDGLRNFFK